MDTKLCRICDEEKPITEFKKGRGRLCKKCDLKKFYEWQEQKPLFKDYGRLKGNAKSRGVDFNISYEEFVNWYDAQERYDDELMCFYCGRQMDSENRRNLNGTTIDRFDPPLGYTPNNMVFCCRRCNMVKGNWFQPDEMLEIAGKYFKDEDKTL